MTLEERLAALEVRVATLEGPPAAPATSESVDGRRSNLVKVFAYMTSRGNAPASIPELTGAVGTSQSAYNVVRSSMFGGWSKYFEKSGQAKVSPSGHALILYRLSPAGLKRAGAYGLTVAAEAVR